jgi:NADPH2:quinone reductase
MKAISIERIGEPEVLKVVARPDPKPASNDLLVRVRAVGVNRADCLQRAGTYPTPPGKRWSDIPGLELAGEVVEIGRDAEGFAVGDRVFGLVAENAYAELALLDHRLAVRIPSSIDYVTAAGVAEVFVTANETVFELGGLAPGETVLVHAGASGVGTAAIQMAKSMGCTVFATVGSQMKAEYVLDLGVDLAILYKTQDFVEETLRASGGQGVDLVEDFIGADYLAKNLAVLKPLGRLVLVGLMGEPTCRFDPAIMLRKRLTIRGFTLRAQSLTEKQAIVERLAERWLPLIASGRIGPIIHATLPLERASDAHALLESNTIVGKVILTVD